MRVNEAYSHLRPVLLRLAVITMQPVLIRGLVSVCRIFLFAFVLKKGNDLNLRISGICGSQINLLLTPTSDYIQSCLLISFIFFLCTKLYSPNRNLFTLSSICLYLTLSSSVLSSVLLDGCEFRDSE